MTTEKGKKIWKVRELRGKILARYHLSMPELAKREGWTLPNMKRVLRIYVGSKIQRPRKGTEAERILLRLEELTSLQNGDGPETNEKAPSVPSEGKDLKGDAPSLSIEL